MAQSAKYMSLGSGVDADDKDEELELGLQDPPHPPPAGLVLSPTAYTPNDDYRRFQDDAQRTENTPFTASTEKFPKKDFRADSVSSSWSGYGDEQRAFQELPADAGPPGWDTLVEGQDVGFDSTLYKTHFERSKQLRTLIWQTMFKWFLSVILILGIVFTFIYYSKMKVMQSREKRVFNTLITGFSLFLGLNIASAFKDQMLAVRWKVLSRRTHSARQIELILSFDSMTKNLELILKKSTYLLLRIGLIIWLCFNFGAQIALAILGLTYELNDYSSHGIGKPGPVAVANLTNFDPGWSQTPIFNGNNQFISHLYGDISTSYLKSAYNPQTNPDDRSIYNFDDSRQVFTYTYRDFHQTDATMWTQSNRTINTTSTCIALPADAGPSGYGNPVLVTYRDGSKHNVSTLGGASTINYILPGQTARGRCGPRCSTVWAFQASVIDSPDSVPKFFVCNITVSPVTNVYDEVHNLSDSNAQLAAAAISLSGFVYTNYAPSEQFEYTRYLSTSYYGAPLSNDVKGMQSLTAEFAIGVVAAMGELNRRANVTMGYAPLDGSKLEVNWIRSGIVLGLLGIGQLFVVLAMSMWATSVIVRDDSHFATARILRPFVKQFGRAGCIVDGKEIAEAYGKKQFLYGVRTLHLEPMDKHHAEIGPADKKLQPVHWFPEGWYD